MICVLHFTECSAQTAKINPATISTYRILGVKSRTANLVNLDTAYLYLHPNLQLIL